MNDSNNQQGFHHIILLLVVVVIGVIGFVGWRVWKNNKNNDTNSRIKTPSMVEKSGAISNCKEEYLFDHIPMKLEDFRAFRPLGFVTIPTHIFGAKHSNFAINKPGETKKGLPVEFPSTALVTQVISTEMKDTTGYQLTFYPCKQFKSYFFHLGTISDKLLKAYQDKQDKRCETLTDSTGSINKCYAEVEVSVSSGELAGTNDGFGGVDWGAVDYRLTEDYANLKRYDGDYPHYTSPILYLRDDLKAAMMNKLGSYDGEVKRTAEPRVGKLNQDVKGTAQGNWFIGDKNFYNTRDFGIFLALLHDYVDPSQPQFSMGSSVKGLNKGLYSFKIAGSGTSNRDFKDVKPDGNTYCYDAWLKGLSAGHLNLANPGGRILLMMSDDSTLKVEFQTGNCNGKLSITSAATIFSR